MCTLVTSGQVASNTCSPRCSRLRLHGARNAVRGEDHRRALGHLDPAPRRTPRRARAADRRRGGCARLRAARRSAAPNSSIARSTMSMARSTPAQKPRGLASSIFMRRLRLPCAAALEQRIEQQQAAPMVMRRSATLKAGNSARSSARARNRRRTRAAARSITLPSAPPRISARRTPAAAASAP